MINQQQERIDFEKWAHIRALPLERENSQYSVYSTELAWQSWLARAKYLNGTIED